MRLPALAFACTLFCAACVDTPPASPRVDPDTAVAAAPPTQVNVGPTARPASAQNCPVPPPSGDLWAEIRADLIFPNFENHAEVRAEIAVLRRDRHLSATLRSRGTHLLPMLASEARARGLPGEVVLLAYVESKLNPDARHAGNVGMWQLQAATALHHGLRIDAVRDERLDPIKSTQASYDYLQRMAQMFDGDWLLAMTAFNTGDGTLRTALAAARGTRDFWHLPLSPGARQHMAKVAALATVIRDPVRYGVTLPPIPTFSYASASPRTSTEPSASVVTAAGPAREVGQGGNAGAGGSAAFTAAVGRARGETQRYQVRSGDTVHSIAQRNHVTVAQLRLANGISTNLIQPGDVLVIPPE